MLSNVKCQMSNVKRCQMSNVKCCQTLVENVGKSKFCDSGDSRPAETDKKSTQKVAATISSEEILKKCWTEGYHLMLPKTKTFCSLFLYFMVALHPPYLFPFATVYFWWKRFLSCCSERNFLLYIWAVNREINREINRRFLFSPNTQPSLWLIVRFIDNTLPSP